jgi:DNA polymerase III alpha subunit (gram-positive type)
MANKWKDHSMTKEICKLLNEDGHVVFFDLETTGISRKKDRILQFAAIRCENKGLKVIEKINLYIKCPFSIPPAITEINHIDDDLLEREGVEEKLAFEKIHNFIKDDDILAGYNSKSFDEKFLEIFYNTYGCELLKRDSIDVYIYAKNIIPKENLMITDEKGKVKSSYKLGVVTNYYFPNNEFDFHDAFEDITATKQVFEKLLEDGKRYIAEFEEEEEKRKHIPRQKVKVFSLGLFNPSQRIQRVYVNTDQGKFYYDHVNHIWASKTGNLDSIDAEDMKNQVFAMVDVNNEIDFYKEMIDRESV